MLLKQAWNSDGPEGLPEHLALLIPEAAVMDAGST